MQSGMATARMNTARMKVNHADNSSAGLRVAGLAVAFCLMLLTLTGTALAQHSRGGGGHDGGGGGPAHETSAQHDARDDGHRDRADEDAGPGTPDDRPDGRDDRGVGVIEAPDDVPDDTVTPDDAAAASAAVPDAALAADPVGTVSDPASDPAAGDVVLTSEGRRSAQPRQFGPVGRSPVVVELFTSQGCSSCPPADEMLGGLADRDDILALSWHVDYWDYLGWTDEFARPEFTRRQQAYARTWGERAIYTPQLIVGGSDTLIALRPAELMALLEARMARPAEVIVSARPQGEGYRIELTPRSAIRGQVAITLVRYVPRREVRIRAGENRGLTAEYRNVVLAAVRIGEWNGRAPLRMNVTPGTQEGGGDFPADTRHVILAQEIPPGSKDASGPILAAIRLD